jgi:hypothetical protein
VDSVVREIVEFGVDMDVDFYVVERSGEEMKERRSWPV